MVVTSFKNEQVRFLKSLSQKKYREEHRVFFAEGLNVVSEGIKSGADVRKIVFSESFASAEGFRKICGELLTPSAEGPGGPRYAQTVGKVLEEALVLSDPVFASVSLTETPQGIGAVFGMGGAGEEECLSGNAVVVLENVQDPGNLGTVIRTADAAGFDAVILMKGCVDAYNPKTIRSTVGSIFHIPVLRIATSSAREAFGRLQNAGFTVYAAHPRGGHTCFEESFEGKSAIVIGNEAKGLTAEAVACCDTLLTIPMPGKAESLNASVAAALLIYEKARKSFASVKWN